MNVVCIICMDEWKIFQCVSISSGLITHLIVSNEQQQCIYYQYTLPHTHTQCLTHVCMYRHNESIYTVHYIRAHEIEDNFNLLMRGVIELSVLAESIRGYSVLHFCEFCCRSRRFYR